MVDQVPRESLSALIDGQASEVEIHRLLRDISDNDALRKSWSRYRQIGEVIKGNPLCSAARHLDLSERIRHAIDREPQGSTVSGLTPARRMRFKRLSGLAVAATVLFAVAMGFLNLGQQSELTTATTAQQVQPTPVQTVAVDSLAAQSREDNMVLDPDLESELKELPPEKQKRLREYLMRMDRRFATDTQVVTFPNKKLP